MSEREEAGLPDKEFAEVMAGLDRAAPLLRATLGKDGGSASSPHHALLCAMKPYLSPARREAAEYLLRLWQVGALIKTMMREG